MAMRSQKFTLLLLSLLLFLPLFLTNFITPNLALADSPKQSQKIVGYFPSWGVYGRNYQVADIDASKLTHLNYAFADICWNGKHGNPFYSSDNQINKLDCKDLVYHCKIKVPNGTLVLGENHGLMLPNRILAQGTTWEDCDKYARGNFGELKRLKAKYPHLKTIISVGGWTWSNRFSDMAADEKTRKVFAESTVAFLPAYGFDGVDLDWEYPGVETIPGGSYRPEDKQNFTLLLQELRNALNKAGAEDCKQYLLTIPSGASQRYADHTELKKISQYSIGLILSHMISTADGKLLLIIMQLYIGSNDPAANTNFYVDGAINVYTNERVSLPTQCPKLLDTLVKELLGGPISQKDTEPPTNVKNIVVTNKNSNSVQLNWTVSTDNVGVTEYEITAGEEKWSTTTNSITIKNLKPNTEYKFSVIAKDAAGIITPTALTVKRSSNATPDGNGTATFSVTSNWGSGYNFSIIIKNNGTTPIKKWKLEFDYSGNLTQVWDSKISSKTNNHYVITNAGWNGEIPPGGSITIGGAGTGNPAELLNAVISENYTLYPLITSIKFEFRFEQYLLNSNFKFYEKSKISQKPIIIIFNFKYEVYMKFIWILHEFPLISIVFYNIILSLHKGIILFISTIYIYKKIVTC
uniref:chitinase n=1 Tax=Bacillus thuringiensis TaxID=1428 RepID=O07088_BACTU|nr:chitinase [Bacillus thuringiensis serovar pakistani]